MASVCSSSRRPILPEMRLAFCSNSARTGVFTLVPLAPSATSMLPDHLPEISAAAIASGMEIKRSSLFMTVFIRLHQLSAFALLDHFPLERAERFGGYDAPVAAGFCRQSLAL